MRFGNPRATAPVSTGRTRIRHLEPGHLCVSGVVAGSRGERALVAWLRARPETVAVETRADIAVIDLRFHDDAPGVAAFLRSMEDQIVAATSTPPPAIAITATHSLPGRVRLRLDGASDDDVLRAAAFLPSLAGVLRASPSPASRSVLVVFDPEVTNLRALVSALRASDPDEWPEVTAAEAPRAGWAPVALATGVAAACVAEVAAPSVLAAGVALTSIAPLRRAWHALRQKRVSVDLLDVAAIGISVSTGQPATAAFITWLLSIGDQLHARTADRARAAISKLVKLDAAEAWRIVGDGDPDEAPRLEKIKPDKLVAGDRILVAAGGRVAADGRVVSGQASVDEKALTGESLPRDARPGDRVLAATVVVEGQIVVEVERVGRDTTAAKIVQILEGAGAKPMTLQRESEKVTDKLVLPSFAVAGGAFAVTGELARATSVLITDFGTGVRIALPTSALAAVTAAARKGILVKGAQYLERLARTDVVLFDKTGTLTEGRVALVRVTPLASLDERAVVALCAAAEAQAAHPIAEAVRAHAAERGIEAPETDAGSVRYAIGRGVAVRVRWDGAWRDVLVGNPRWMGDNGIAVAAHAGAAAALERNLALHASSLLVAVDGALVGAVAYADRPRAESREVVAALQRPRRGVRREVHLLSGDARASVEAVARAVGVDAAVGEMLPEDKAEYVRALQRRGKTVAMVGDGINDAPALALADVGISLHGGTDVALETADVLLLEGGLARLDLAFRTGERAMATVKQSLGLVVAPNAVAILLGALGLLNPALAALVNNGSTVVAALYAMTPLLGGDRR